MADLPPDPIPLSPGTERFVAGVLQSAPAGGAGLSLWIRAIAERFGLMVQSLVPALTARDLLQRIGGEIAAGRIGPVLDRARVVALASEEAERANRAVVAERDLVAAILRQGGYTVAVAAPAPTSAAVPSEPAGTVPGAPLRQTPALDRFGRDLTAAARAGRLGPVIERDREIDLVVETLCRRTKPNPLLVGPAGTGKTAIVEGLAQRIAAGQVPPRLTGVRLVALQPSLLVGGASLVGDLQKRMEAILGEATDPGIVLFIDEIQTIIGAGGAAGTGDLASLLKPVLARGDLACIGATTDDEYRQFIEPDRALERRFNPIRVSELTPQQTLAVLRKVRATQAAAPPAMPEDLLAWIVEVARQAMPNRRFPDKALDLLDQITAYGVSRGLASVGRPEAEEVVRRILGRAFTGGAELDRLAQELTARKWCSAHLAEELVDQLRVAVRGLDLRPERPNAVIGLPGWDSTAAESLGGVIAETVYGDPNRTVVIDLGLLREAEDLKTLIGAPPSFVGYGDRHALDAVIETPHTVLVLERIDEAHRVITDVIGPALISGGMRDARSRRVHLSDAIVLLTFAAADGSRRPVIGFGTATDAPAPAPTSRELEESLNPAIARAIHLTFPAPGGDGEPAAGASTEWISADLLHTIADRHYPTGVELVWDPSVVSWLETVWSAEPDRNRLEQIADHELSAPIVRQLYEPRAAPVGKFLVLRVNGQVQIKPVKPKE
jgi:ATP-dependent Clp protease ATP-binding subunit ClpC